MSKEEIRKSNTIKMLEYKYNLDIEELLYQDYFVNGLSMRKIADKYGITLKIVHKYIRIYEIPKKQIKL